MYGNDHTHGPRRWIGRSAVLLPLIKAPFSFPPGLVLSVPVSAWFIVHSQVLLSPSVLVFMARTQAERLQVLALAHE